MMGQQHKEELINLKEAAAMSGYSPDYIGQLIRKGKLPGKQVYSNVAWMTTKEAIISYMGGESGKTKSSSRGENSKESRQSILTEETTLKLYKGMLYAGILFSVIFLLLFFYIFSIGFEKNLEKKAIQKIDLQNELQKSSKNGTQ